MGKYLVFLFVKDPTLILNVHMIGWLNLFTYHRNEVDLLNHWELPFHHCHIILCYQHEVVNLWNQQLFSFLIVQLYYPQIFLKFQSYFLELPHQKSLFLLDRKLCIFIYLFQLKNFHKQILVIRIKFLIWHLHMFWQSLHYYLD